MFCAGGRFPGGGGRACEGSAWPLGRVSATGHGPPRRSGRLPSPLPARAGDMQAGASTGQTSCDIIRAPRPLWGTHLPNSTASGTWGERLHTVTALWATPRLVPCCPHIPGVVWPIGCCDSPFVTHDGRPAGRDALEPTALGCAGRPAGPTLPLWPDTHVRPHRGPGPPGSHTVTLVSTGTRRPIHSINVYFKLGEIHIT